MVKRRVGDEVWWYNKTLRTVMSGDIEFISLSGSWYNVGKHKISAWESFNSRAELLTEMRKQLEREKVDKENQYLKEIEQLNKLLLDTQIEYGHHLDVLDREQSYEEGDQSID